MVTMPIQVQMRRRTSIALFSTIALILIVAFSSSVKAQTTITQYRIQLNGDGSANWTITQVSDLNGSVDTFAGFEGKVISLVDAAANQTNRQMSVESTTFQTSTVISSNNSKTTGYSFTWSNFSVTNQGILEVGDVFSLNGFFDRLYGNGALQINFPANYTLETVAPKPDQQDLSTQTLEWLGTQFFVTENPQIISRHCKIRFCPALPLCPGLSGCSRGGGCSYCSNVVFLCESPFKNQSSVIDADFDLARK